MPRHLAWAAVVLFFPVFASAQTQAPAKPQPHSPVIKPSTPGKAPWDFSLTVDGYLIEDGDDYAQPTFTADHKWLHLEARYNYENFHTGSVWGGYNFSWGKSWQFSVTPMIGGVFGRTNGIARDAKRPCLGRCLRSRWTTSTSSTPRRNPAISIMPGRR